MAVNALTVRKPSAITIHRDADLYRLGALILSTLDRLGVPDQQFSRIVVYSQRLVVFDLPWLTPTRARDLLAQRLTPRIAPYSVVWQRRGQGCAIIIDLHPNF